MVVAIIPGIGHTPASAVRDPQPTVWDDTARLTDAIDHAPNATRSPLLTAPDACWQDSHSDHTRDVPKGDIAVITAAWNCTTNTMRMWALFVVGRSDGVGYVAFALDTDGRFSNHCGGAEYIAMVSLRGSSAGTGRLWRFGVDCEADYVSEVPLTATTMGIDPPRVGLDIPIARIGNISTFHFQAASFDASVDLLDLVPSGGTAWFKFGGFRSATWGDVTTFVPGAPVSINGSYSHQAPGDFNGDGFDDVALAGNGPLGDALKRGGPNGFVTRADFALHGTYDCVLGTDYDGDGDDDLILVAYGSGPDATKRGGPNGFVSGHPLDVPGVYEHCLAGDFNGDGLGDFALIAGDGGVSLLKRSVGDGTWTDRAFRVTTHVDDATSADFNRDERDDLLLLEWGSGPDSLLMGTTGGVTPWSFDVGGTYDDVQAGDFNADGYADVVYYGRGPAADQLRRGHGTGKPIAPAPVPFVAQFDRIPLIGDFDGNGTDDIVWFAPGTTGDLNWRGVR